MPDGIYHVGSRGNNGEMLYRDDIDRLEWLRRFATIAVKFRYSDLIEDDSHLLEACRYIVLNPVRAGLCGSPADWPWSSYRACAGMELAHP